MDGSDSIPATSGVGAPNRVYRGVIMSDGMTPDCLDAMARIINRHASGDTDELDAECAARLYATVRSFQLRTGLGKS
jgi:hypothetical protein